MESPADTAGAAAAGVPTATGLDTTGRFFTSIFLRESRVSQQCFTNQSADLNIHFAPPATLILSFSLISPKLARIFMPDPAPNAELLRSLGRLVRGLSALFWGLPIALITCVWTAYPQWIKSFGFVPPLVATGLLVYGLWQIGGFQRQERVWRNALDRALVLAIINFGLSPFVYWWSRVPGNRFFLAMVIVMTLCGLLFLGSINYVLRRLGAM